MSESGISAEPPVLPALAGPCDGAAAPEEQEGSGASRELQCSGCLVWPRQQSWLCAVPLLIGCVGLGLSLMLLRWIVVGSVRDYTPPDRLDTPPHGGQDPIFLSKPSSAPKHGDSSRHPPPSPSPGPGPGALPSPPATSPASQTPHTTQPSSPPPPWPLPLSTSSTKLFLHDSTPSWTLPRAEAGSTAARTPPAAATAATTTYTTQRSEHYKPCKDKDLSYCLNDGECFMIETLAGNNKHCRCKDGYQGVRCDQYLPKTDSILSDPKSQELYQRQILSITCITIGLMVVGMLCVVLYCKTRKQRQKLRDEARELRYSKSYSLQPSPLSGPGLIPQPQPQPQPHRCTKVARFTGNGRRKIPEPRFSGPAPQTPDTPSAGTQCVTPQRRPSSSSLPSPALRATARPSPPLARPAITRSSGPVSLPTTGMYQELDPINKGDTERFPTASRITPMDSLTRTVPLSAETRGQPSLWTACAPGRAELGEVGSGMQGQRGSEPGVVLAGPATHQRGERMPVLACSGRRPEDYQPVPQGQERALKATTFLAEAGLTTTEELAYVARSEHQSRNSHPAK